MTTLDEPARADPSPAEAGLPASERSRRSPVLVPGELLAVVVAAILLAVITSWPLAAHLGSTIAPDLGDPVRTAWQIAWTGHELLHHPLHLWNSNAFWPRPNSLLFSDSLLGYSPIGVLGSGPTAALVRYNLLFILAYALPFVGAFLLARELGIGRAASTVAGMGFAYAPFRASEAGHLHVISSGGLALTLFLLLRGYRRRSPVLVTAGWLVATWQMSLGFTLGLQLAYLLLIIAAIAAFVWLYRRWRGDPQRPALDLWSLRPALVLVTMCGAIAFAGVGGYQARAYLHLAKDYPTARRTVAEVTRYSAPPKAWLVAPVENVVWGDATRSLRQTLSSQNESTLFPGAVIFVLALVGLASALYTRRLRAGLAVGIVVCSTLALGFGLAGGHLYRPFFDHVPGFDGIRTPGRIITLASLGLALLAAAGGQRLALLASRWRHAATGVALALAALVLLEGSEHMAHHRVPMLPRAEVGLPQPILHLPIDPASDRLYQYWSTEGFPFILNGNSTFDIPSLDNLRGSMHNFPEPLGIDKLRRLGVRTIVLHTDLDSFGLPDAKCRGLASYRPEIGCFSIPEPPNAAQAAVRPIAGLPLTRRQVGNLVIYTVTPLTPRASGGRP
ncbi:MAG TPA: hypothetical protein VGN69_04815 [Solirubrobacteraceae bacterium]|jgi:hypothetical protein|nr:hypothetical protein [Solirubrobacteraceae bacterium]